MLFKFLSFLLALSSVYAFEQTERLEPKISVVGTGYVGLVSAACFAQLDTDVICVDKDQRRIQALQEKKIPIYEPGLEEIVKTQIDKQRISFALDTIDAVSKSNIAMICVGTPSKEDGSANLDYVFAAAREIALGIKDYTLVVIKSTVPVGTCQKVAEVIQGQRSDLIQGINFDVASNPEFLREGSAIWDFMNPDRIVVGFSRPQGKAQNLIKALYEPLTKKGFPLVLTDLYSSELSKYASNAFLAMKISFVNQLSDLCEKAGGNIEEISKIMGLDNRIGSLFLKTGPGFGGSCFPKDTKALVDIAHHYNTDLSLVSETVSYNAKRKQDLAQRVVDIFQDQGIEKPRLGVWGITFKANTDDLRDSPALDIIPFLLEKGVDISVWDPMYSKNTPFKPTWPVDWAQDLYDSVEGKDGLLVLTEWQQFKNADLKQVKEALAHPLIIDYRNLFDESIVEGLGLTYEKLGKKRKV